MLAALGIFALLGYLIGSVNFAVLVAKKHGVDILKEGSGNPGATNVKRVLGKGPGNLVFALDALRASSAPACRRSSSKSTRPCPSRKPGRSSSSPAWPASSAPCSATASPAS